MIATSRRRSRCLPYGFDDLDEPVVVELDLDKGFRWRSSLNGAHIEGRREGELLQRVRRAVEAAAESDPSLRVTCAIHLERRNGL